MIVGTAGHVDHGKTSLVRALTGVDTDRLKEEKARGISIELGFAYLPTPGDGVIGFVDVPGHERFVRTMVAGAAGIDFVLLVVAADDGIMPQTREHLAIIELLGLTRGLVALTKIDAVDAGRIDQVRSEIADVLLGSPLAGAKILPISSVTGSGVEVLRSKLCDAAAQCHQRSSTGSFRLAVDRSFTLAGAGTVVTGTVLSGAVDVGDRVVVSPSGLQARVRSIHAQNQPATRGMAGDRCALNLSGDSVSKDAISRGDFVVASQLHAPTARIDATFRLLPSEAKTLEQWAPVRLHFAATEMASRVVVLDSEGVAPDERALVQLVLEAPVAAAVGDRFVLRDTTGQRTIGGGAFLDLRPPARRRKTSDRLAVLRALAGADPELVLAELLTLPPFFVDLTAFIRNRATGPAMAEELGKKSGLAVVTVENAIVAFETGRYKLLRGDIRAALKRFHAEHPERAGIGADALQHSIELRLPRPLFRACLQQLTTEGGIAIDGAVIRLGEHKTRLSGGDQRDWLRIEPLLAGANRFRPPRATEIAKTLQLAEPGVRRLLKQQARMGAVDEIAPDHFLLRPALTEMARIAADLSRAAPTGEFTAAQFRDRLDNGRKVAIQVLELLDRRGITHRRGDLRRVDPQRLERLDARPQGECTDT